MQDVKWIGLYLLIFILAAASCKPDKGNGRIIGNNWAARSQLLVVGSSNPLYRSSSYWYNGNNDIQLFLHDNGSLVFKYFVTPAITTPISPQPVNPVTIERREQKSSYIFAGDSIFIVRATDTALLRMLYAGERFPGNNWPHGDSIFLHQLTRDSMVSRFHWTKKIYDQVAGDSATLNYSADIGFRKI